MATLSQMGIPGVGNGMLMPKLKHKWRVTFQGIGAGASSDLSMSAVTVSRPSISWEETEINRYNSKSYVAGKHQWEPMNLTIEDDITGKASAIIASQIDKQQELIGAAGGNFLKSAATGSAYKFAAKLELLDGGERVVELWKITGCFLQSVNYNELDYGASDAVTIDLTVRFDHASQELEKLGLGTALGGF